MPAIRNVTRTVLQIVIHFGVRRLRTPKQVWRTKLAILDFGGAMIGGTSPTKPHSFPDANHIHARNGNFCPQ